MSSEGTERLLKESLEQQKLLGNAILTLAERLSPASDSRSLAEILKEYISGISNYNLGRGLRLVVVLQQFLDGPAQTLPEGVNLIKMLQTFMNGYAGACLKSLEGNSTELQNLPTMPYMTALGPYFDLPFLVHPVSEPQGYGPFRSSRGNFRGRGRGGRGGFRGNNFNYNNY
jgi:hypothetical protein